MRLDGHSLTFGMATLAVFQTGALAACTKLAAIVLPAFADALPGRNFTTAITTRAILFHERYLLTWKEALIVPAEDPSSIPGMGNAGVCPAKKAIALCGRFWILQL